MRILAVDDESYILELIPLIAAKCGFPDVTTVSSGRRALDEIASTPIAFDCLLLDINMPGMTGIELCARVRQVAAYRKTPIIMLTAMTDQDYIDSAFRAGATDYATKPFDIKELGARLRVAQDLIAAWTEVARTKDAVAAALLPAAAKRRSDLANGAPLDGAKDLLDLASLKNYLKQISRAGLAASQVIALRVDRIDDLYDRASSEEFAYALREVFAALSDALRTHGCLIAYAGRGVFVVVSNRATPLASADLESDVQQILDDKNSEYDSGAPMDLEVSVGNPIQPDYGDVADVSDALDRAMARAESRYAAKKATPPAPNIFGGGP